MPRTARARPHFALQRSRGGQPATDESVGNLGLGYRQADRVSNNHTWNSAARVPMRFNMMLDLPVAAVGYALVYIIFGGGIGGAILIFIIAKMLGK